MSHRLLRFTVALMGGLAFTLVLAFWVHLAEPARAALGVLYVAASGNCNGANPCYASVQAAVDAAAPGDEIRVAAGTYTGVSARQGVTQVVYISKTITLQGGYTTTNWITSDPDANTTTLDAQGQGRVLYVIGDISPTIEGLYITSGNATGMGGGYFGFDCGGGVYLNHRDVSSAATLRDNQVFSNTAIIGGGLCLYFGTPTLIGNVVFANTAESGGGLWLDRSDATLGGNIIFSNTAESGGGLFLLSFGHADTLNGNAIFSNTAELGGGLFLQSSAATLSGNTISRNTADGMNLWDGGGGLQMCCDSAPTLINNVFADNWATSGSGLKIRSSSPLLLHNTIARNNGGDGSGIYVMKFETAYSTVAMTNTILASHTIGISVTDGNTVTVNGVLWYDTAITVSQSITAIVTVQNQHTGSPAFAHDGYHLTTNSAAINVGVNAGLTSDIDGQMRDAQPDIGADEYIEWLVYLPLVSKNYSP